jgi:hypothetical protein
VAVAIALAPGAGAQSGQPGLKPSPRDVVYDFVPVGQTSAKQTVTVTSTGSAALKVSKLTLGGPHPNDFRVVDDTCTGATVAPAATCTVGVVFAPTQEGTRVSHLRFDSNARCPEWITLAGSGVTQNTRQAPQCAPAPAATTTPGPTGGGGAGGGGAGGGSNTSAGEVLGDSESSRRRCPGRRRVRIHFHTPIHTRLVRAYAAVAGRKFTVRIVRRKAHWARGFYTSVINFKGLRRARYRVKVRGRLDNGERYRRDRIFKNCVRS